MSNMMDWSYKEQTNKKGNSYKKNKVVKKKKKKIKRKWLQTAKGDDFYKSGEWLRLRYRVIKKYGGECMACGRSRKMDGVTIHVDHIKPRSKHPHLCLEFSNLQILCSDCNQGKLNLDQTDWRPDDIYEELDILYEARLRL